jgi:hypothetical protein
LIWCPCYVPKSMLHIHVNAAYPFPCCISMYMLHVDVYAAWTWTCNMDIDIQHGIGLAAWTWTCRMMDMENPCSMGTEMQDRNGNAAWTSTWCMSMSKFMSMLGQYVHAVCPRPCCQSMLMLYFRFKIRNKNFIVSRNKPKHNWSVLVFRYVLVRIETKNKTVSLDILTPTYPPADGFFWLLPDIST